MIILKKLISNIWFWIGLVIAVLVALLGSEKAKRKLAEINLFKVDLDGKLSLSKQRSEYINADIKKERELRPTQPQKADELKPNEVEDFWNKKS